MSFLFVNLALAACVSRPPHPGLQLLPENEYYEFVARSTEHAVVYDGLYNILDFNATLMNSKVYLAQVDEHARLSQWPDEQYNSEKAKVRTALAKETEMVLLLFVPERKEDDLNKSKTTWRLFLDVDGHRYEGKAEKIKALYEEVLTLYPHQNRWSTPYRVRFPVPMTSIEKSEAKFTITGPVTSATVTFKPVN